MKKLFLVLLIFVCLIFCGYLLLVHYTFYPAFPRATLNDKFNEVRAHTIVYNRIASIGGKRYENLVNREVSFLIMVLNFNGKIVEPDKLKIEQLKKELKGIFWWCWWLKGEYILNMFWCQCVFKVIDQQKISRIPAVELKYMWMEAHPYSFSH